MSQLDAVVRISAIDNASAVFARVAAHAKSIGQQFRSIVAAPQQQAAQLSAAAAHFERTAATTMFAPTAGALSVGILGRDAYQWDRAMATLKAISEAGPEDMDSFVAKVQEVSNAFGIQRHELALAGQTWVNIGGKLGDVVPVLERVAKTSRLMGVSVSEALKESRAMMIAFGVDPNKKENVFDFEDYFVIGAKNQPYGGAGFLEGMKQFAPIAGALHLPKEVAAAMFETMVQGGFQPGESGRGLKTGLSRLAAPTRDMINELAAAGIGPEKLFELGIGRISDIDSLQRRFEGAGLSLPPHAQQVLRKAFDAYTQRTDAGEEVNLLQFSADLTKDMTDSLGIPKGDARNKGIVQKLIWNHFMRAMEGLNMDEIFKLGQEPLSAMARVFGKEHVAKWLELFRNEGRFKQNLLTHTTQQSGAVERKFSIWAQGFAFQWDRVMASFNNLLGSISGRGVSGDISHVFGALASMFEGLQAMDPTMVRAGFWMTALAAAAPVAALAIGSFKQLAGAALFLVGRPWRAALTALAAFGTYAYSQNLGGFADALTELADALTELAGAAMTLGPMITDAGQAFDAFYQSFKASAGIAGDANILTDTFTLLGNSIRTIAQAFREASAAYAIWKNRDNPDWVPSPDELDKLNRRSFEQHRDRAQLPTDWETIPLHRPPWMTLPSRPGEPLLPPSQSSGSLIMDLFKAGAGGLQLPPVSVTGQVSGQMQITVKVDGPGQVTEQSGGQISGPLNTGQGMGDVSSSGLPTFGQ